MNNPTKKQENNLLNALDSPPAKPPENKINTAPKYPKKIIKNLHFSHLRVSESPVALPQSRTPPSKIKKKQSRSSKPKNSTDGERKRGREREGRKGPKIYLAPTNMADEDQTPTKKKNPAIRAKKQRNRARHGRIH